MTLKIKGKVRGLGQFYKLDNLERFEIDLYLNKISDLPVMHKQRVELKLNVNEKIYICGIRYLEGVGVWVCPDIYESNGKRLRLSELLISNNIFKNQNVLLIYNPVNRELLLSN